MRRISVRRRPRLTTGVVVVLIGGVSSVGYGTTLASSMPVASAPAAMTATTPVRPPAHSPAPKRSVTKQDASTQRAPESDVQRPERTRQPGSSAASPNAPADLRAQSPTAPLAAEPSASARAAEPTDDAQPAVPTTAAPDSSPTAPDRPTPSSESSAHPSRDPSARPSSPTGSPSASPACGPWVELQPPGDPEGRAPSAPGPDEPATPPTCTSHQSDPVTPQPSDSPHPTGHADQPDDTPASTPATESLTDPGDTP